MKISDVIAALKAVKAEIGDADVLVTGPYGAETNSDLTIEAYRESPLVQTVCRIGTDLFTG